MVLDQDVADYISLVNKSVQKEKVFITQKDWSIEETLEGRIKLHDIQRLLIDRNINHATKLYDLASTRDCLAHKDVKDMIKSLLEFFYIYESRYDVYVESQDWSSYLEDGETSIKNPEKEIQFSSEVAKWVSNYQSKVRKIHDSEDGSRVLISTQKDTPVPFLMRRTIEEKYDSVADLMKDKLKRP